MRVRVALLVCALASSGLCCAAESVCPPIRGADAHPTFDATLLKEGRFTYHLTLNGKSLGEIVIEVRHVGANFVISMNAPEIGQAWKATVAKSFAPRSASLAMQRKTGDYAMELQYAGARISGEEHEGGVTRPVNATAKGVVIDQRVDWASMMAANAPAGSSIAVQVFDPSTGLSAMLGTMDGTQSLSGALSEVEALRLHYTICKREHLEEYTVYATRETPRYMLREDMPNGLVSELVRIEP